MNPAKLFFTSDTHFGHKALVGHGGKRPFPNVDVMDETLIERWNSVVPHNGTVFHLGDVSFHKVARSAELLGALHGTIHLVTGNHDEGFMTKPQVRDRFASMTPMHGTRLLRLEGVKIILCHFPYSTWYASHHGSWHLHGHSHGSTPKQGRRLDVGVDCHAFTPVSFRELQTFMDMRPIESGDGHKPRERRLEIVRGPV